MRIKNKCRGKPPNKLPCRNGPGGFVISDFRFPISDFSQREEDGESGMKDWESSVSAPERLVNLSALSASVVRRRWGDKVKWRHGGDPELMEWDPSNIEDVSDWEIFNPICRQFGKSKIGHYQSLTGNKHARDWVQNTCAGNLPWKPAGNNHTIFLTKAAGTKRQGEGVRGGGGSGQ